MPTRKGTRNIATAEEAPTDPPSSSTRRSTRLAASQPDEVRGSHLMRSRPSYDHVLRARGSGEMTDGEGGICMGAGQEAAPDTTTSTLPEESAVTRSRDGAALASASLSVLAIKKPQRSIQLTEASPTSLGTRAARPHSAESAGGASAATSPAGSRSVTATQPPSR